MQAPSGAKAASPVTVGAAIPFVLMSKDGLTLRNDRAVNAETPPHLLDDPITPTERHFIRDNGIPPAEMNADTWTLTVYGMVDNPIELTIADLKSVSLILIEGDSEGHPLVSLGATGASATAFAIARCD